MPIKHRLRSIRNRIDELDEKIQELLAERVMWAQQVATVKEESSEHKTEFFCPEREHDVLEHLKHRNKGPISDDDLCRIFKEIISVCRAIQQPPQIAYLGPEGTFSQAAVFKHFGGSVDARPVTNVDDIFHQVSSEQSRYGVVPIENSTEGFVNSTLDAFIHSDLVICGEIELPVHHCFLAADENLKKPSIIYSHQQSFAQCRKWLNKNQPEAELVTCTSNAEAARQAQANPKNAAAIASAIAGEIYQLKNLAKHIEDNPNNTTRFFVIGKNMPKESTDDKTSLLIKCTNQPGALSNILEPFKASEINLSRIESRPSHDTKWEYVFFIDVDGHSQSKKLAKALDAIEKHGFQIKILGSYPKAVY